MRSWIFLYDQIAKIEIWVPPNTHSFAFSGSYNLLPSARSHQNLKHLLLNHRENNISALAIFTMAFYLEHNRRAPGTSANQISPFEAVAEELLNGLLCHYEPPPNKRLMSLPEIERQEQLSLCRPPSILKTSSSFDGSNKHKKGKGRYVRFTGIIRSSKSSRNNGQRAGFLQKLKRRKASF